MLFMLWLAFILTGNFLRGAAIPFGLVGGVFSLVWYGRAVLCNLSVWTDRENRPPEDNPEHFDRSGDNDPCDPVPACWRIHGYLIAAVGIDACSSHDFGYVDWKACFDSLEQGAIHARYSLCGVDVRIDVAWPLFPWLIFNGLRLFLD